MASNPADYVKIRDGLYLFSFIEERQLGIQAIFLIDLKEVRDIGCFYGVGSGRLSSACVGVKGTLADPAVTIAEMREMLAEAMEQGQTSLVLETGTAGWVNTEEASAPFTLLRKYVEQRLGRRIRSASMLPE